VPVFLFWMFSIKAGSASEALPAFCVGG